MIDAAVQVGGESNNSAGGIGPVAPVVAANDDAFHSLLLRQQALEQKMEQNQNAVMEAIAQLRQEMKAGFQLLNNNIRRFCGRIEEGSFMRQGNSNRGRCLSGRIEANNAAVEVPVESSNATLSPLPRDLLLLWREYQHGLNGRKAARLFTTRERNTRQNKQKYYRRNVVWQCMKRQIARGLTPEQAAGELLALYGSKKKPTEISICLVADRKRYKDSGGYHPNLSV